MIPARLSEACDPEPDSSELDRRDAAREPPTPHPSPERQAAGEAWFAPILEAYEAKCYWNRNGGGEGE